MEKSNKKMSRSESKNVNSMSIRNLPTAELHKIGKQYCDNQNTLFAADTRNNNTNNRSKIMEFDVVIDQLHIEINYRIMKEMTDNLCSYT